KLLNAPVSVGTDITQPDRLETRTSGELLGSIRDGKWRSEVEAVRALPFGSSAQRRVKLELPFVLWAGQFSRRDSQHLLQHSGLVGIDLDGLNGDAMRVMHLALEDSHCLAGFKSAGG